MASQTDDEQPITGDRLLPVLKPGFASSEPIEEDPEPQAPSISHAHYDGCTDEEAADVWESETLCRRCLCAGVCAIARATTQGSLTVVSRCLAYLPASG